MPLNQETTRLTFRKLNRQLSRLASNPAPENIHKFRASSRRVEVLVADLAQERSRNDRKLLKLLGRLRKKAGRVRDLDVQTAALRSLKIPQEPVRKSQLLRTIAEERGKREKKLAKALAKMEVAEVRKRLKRTAGSLQIPNTIDPRVLAMQKVADLEPGQAAVTEQTLHRFRVAVKRARYIAELAGQNAESARLVERLRHVQDAIGDWHDWAQLAERAEKLFGGVRDSALVAALRNITRAKFRQAVNTLIETRTELAGKKPTAVATLEPQPSRRSATPDAAVA
jgi:CHAD domain-containing protein